MLARPYPTTCYQNSAAACTIDAAPFLTKALAGAVAAGRPRLHVSGFQRLLSQVVWPVSTQSAPGPSVLVEGDGWADGIGNNPFGTVFSVGYTSSSPFYVQSVFGGGVIHAAFTQDQPNPGPAIPRHVLDHSRVDDRDVLDFSGSGAEH